MKAITVGQLRQNPTSMLGEVEAGEAYRITRHDREIAAEEAVTTDVSAVRAVQVLLEEDSSGLRRPLKAHAERLRAVSVDRIGDLVGRLAPRVLSELDAALRLHLDL